MGVLMTSNTWFKLYRGWQNNPMFRSDKDKLNWLWLIENAVVDEVTISINNKPVKIYRGQLCYSLAFLAKAWDTTPSYVRHFLKHLKLWQAIDTQNDKGQTLITLCNYCKYQDSHTQNDKGNNKKTTRQRQGNDNNTKNDNNDKECKNVNTPLPPKGDIDDNSEFTKFWNQFPRQRRGNKHKALSAYKRAIREKRATEDEIMAGLLRYRESKSVKDGYAKGCQAWINDDLSLIHI